MDIQPQTLRKSPEKKPKQGFIKLAMVATAIAVASSLIVPYAVNNGDDLSQAQSAQIAESMRNISPVQLELVKPEEMADALDTIPLEPQVKQQLVQDLQKQDASAQPSVAQNELPSLTLTDQPQLVWLDLWDFASQDGDVVQVSSGGYNVQVNLLKSPSKIAVPVKGNMVQLTGIEDGGGGITVGVNAGSAQQLVIQPGTQFALPVSF